MCYFLLNLDKTTFQMIFGAILTVSKVNKKLQLNHHSMMDSDEPISAFGQGECGVAFMVIHPCNSGRVIPWGLPRECRDNAVPSTG